MLSEKELNTELSKLCDEGHQETLETFEAVIGRKRFNNGFNAGFLGGAGVTLILSVGLASLIDAVKAKFKK